MSVVHIYYQLLTSCYLQRVNCLFQPRIQKPKETFLVSQKPKHTRDKQTRGLATLFVRVAVCLSLLTTRWSDKPPKKGSKKKAAALQNGYERVANREWDRVLMLQLWYQKEALVRVIFPFKAGWLTERGLLNKTENSHMVGKRKAQYYANTPNWDDFAFRHNQLFIPVWLRH